MNAVAAEVVEPAALPVSRRFQDPDLDKHGLWLVPRLLNSFKHMNQRELVGWLRGIVASNEFLFLYQDHAVGLAQAMRVSPLRPDVIVQEWFVFVEDKENKQHLAEAAMFYEDMLRWGKTQGATRILVEELSDVPHEMIKEKLGRLFETKQIVARI